ncbi:MAG: DUF2027 domain-containing protein [Muribaculaceae bacterium]
MSAKVGDTVRFLNAVGGGQVTRIADGIAYVADSDGFETPVMLRECVVVASPSAQPHHAAPAAKSAAATSMPKQPSPQIADIPTIEPPDGDTLNIVVAFEPSDLRRLSEATFDAFIVNDSNYQLSIMVATRERDDRLWTPRYAGVIEPNMQEFLFELTREDLPHIDRFALQYIACKPAKPFALKAPASVELSFDATKFAKLHCFAKSEYFDTPVITLDITRHDVAARPAYDPQRLVSAADTASPKPADTRRRQPHAPHASASADEPLVIDLHIHELLDNTAGLSNADMLNCQIDKFREVMDQNLHNYGRKIIFIHGKGEGVLRQAITKELNNRYKGHDVQDASFREYGFGATQVCIRQHTAPSSPHKKHRK